MSLIMRKPGEPPINIFAFLLPFTNNLWLSTIVVVRFFRIVRYHFTTGILISIILNVLGAGDFNIPRIKTLGVPRV